MDSTLIEPLVASLENVFMTMLQVPVCTGRPKLKQSAEAPRDVSGVIGLSGDVTGSIVLSFPFDTAHAVVGLFCGELLECDDAEYADAIGEIANMVAGGAKANLDTQAVTMACPTVVVGRGHFIAHQKGVPCIVIPCSTDCGGFTVEVAIRRSNTSVFLSSGSANANT